MTIPNNSPKDAAEYEAPLDELEAKLDGFDSDSLDEVSAAELNDTIKAIQALGKRADADRVVIKKPHFEAGKRVDAEFKPISNRVADLAKKGKSVLTPYLIEQARIAREARELAEREAVEKARIAEQLANDALVGDSVKAEADDAVAKLVVASAVESNAGRVGSASGMARTASLRTYRSAVITDAEKAAIYFCSHPSVQDAIVSAANAIIRNAKGGFVKIDGMEIKEEKRVA